MEQVVQKVNLIHYVQCTCLGKHTQNIMKKINIHQLNNKIRTYSWDIINKLVIKLMKEDVFTILSSDDQVTDSMSVKH